VAVNNGCSGTALCFELPSQRSASALPHRASKLKTTHINTNTTHGLRWQLLVSGTRANAAAVEVHAQGVWLSR